MRGSTSLLAALSTCLVTTSALPHINFALRPRADGIDGAKKPSYSVVPLEPGDDNGGGNSGGGDGNPPSGGNGGNGGNGGDGGGGDATSTHAPETVTVTETVVQTQEAVTRFVTVAQEPQTVTQVVPTTVVSIVDVAGPGTTITVTQTPPTSAAASSSPATSDDVDPIETVSKTVTVIDGLPPSNWTIPTPSTSVLSPSSILSPSSSLIGSLTPSIASSQPATRKGSSSNIISVPTGTQLAPSSSLSTPATSIVTSAPTIQVPPTTMTTSCKESSSSSSSSTRTYDDGMWHTTYPPWNATNVQRYR